jgi:hydrogenase-4 component E
MMIGVNVVNSLAGLLIITSLLVIETGKIKWSALLYGAQSFVLVLTFLALAVTMHADQLYLWAATALVTKVILVPTLLYRTLNQFGDQRPLKGWLSPAMSLLVAAVVLAISFAIVTPFELKSVTALKPALAISVAHFFLGLLCILTQRNLLKQVLGYCLMENGSHLTLAIMAYKAPELVEVGVATDAIFAVVIMVAISTRIFQTMHTLDSEKLMSLKG